MIKNSKKEPRTINIVASITKPTRKGTPNWMNPTNGILLVFGLVYKIYQDTYTFLVIDRFHRVNVNKADTIVCINNINYLTAN